MLSAGKPEKILIVSQFFYPDVTACAFRIKETADWLANNGCEVHVIAGEPHKGQLENQTLSDGKLIVSRVPLFKSQGKGKWNYIRHYLSFMFGALKHSAKHPGNFDVVWASSPPLFTGIAGYLLAKRKKARFCLDIRDIWPESAVVAGQISSDGLLFKAGKIAEKLLYKLANHITCVARPMADYIARTGRVKRPTVIYNAIPAAMLGSEPEKRHSQPHTFTILYIGNMGFCQHLGLVVDAARLLAAKNCSNIKFKLVGNGVEKGQLKELKTRYELTNLEICDIVSKSEAINLIKSSEALMLHLKDDGTMDKTIPSKVFDYMAGGNPILYGLKGEAATVLSESGGNLYYEPTNPASLASQAIKLSRNYENLATKARKNRDLVKARFLRESMAQRLLKVFRQL